MSDKTKKVINNIFVGLGVAFMVLFIIGVFSQSNDEPTKINYVQSEYKEGIKNKINEEVNNTESDNIFKESYVDACVDGGATAAYCKCSYNYLEDVIGTDEMASIGLRIMNATMTDRDIDIMLDAAWYCME